VSATPAPAATAETAPSQAQTGSGINPANIQSSVFTPADKQAYAAVGRSPLAKDTEQAAALSAGQIWAQQAYSLSADASAGQNQQASRLVRYI